MTTANPSKTNAGAKADPNDCRDGLLEERFMLVSVAAAEPEDIARDYLPALPFSQPTLLLQP